MNDLFKTLQQLPAPLLDWYAENRRVLPWREEVSPYRTWISEIMLQQTRVTAVLPYFERFMAAYPTVRDLAAADDGELMRLWQGLGYYSRARNLKRAAQRIAENFGGTFPVTYKDLITLPGIGDYTAGAILSIAMGQTVPAVDGNVLRVVSRVCGYDGDITDPKRRKLLRDAVAAILPEGHAGEFNQAMMDLGATVCLPHGTPLCDACPFSPFCAAHAAGQESRFPVKAPKKGKRTEEKTVFLLRRGQETALRQRPENGLLAGLWEFPNTPGTLNETQAAAWLSENHIIPHLWLKKVHYTHEFTHILWKITAYIVEVAGNGQSDWVWCDPEEQQRRAIPSAFQKLVKEIE